MIWGIKMANVKITELPAIISLALDDVLPIVDISEFITKKSTIQQLQATIMGESPTFNDIKVKSPWADIRAYGADGTPANDTAALIAALAASRNIYIPPGTWLIYDTGVVRAGTSFLGVPGQSRLKAAPTLPDDVSILENENPGTFTDEDITSKGVIFDGNSGVLTERTTSVVNFRRVTNLRINQCKFQNDSWMGLNFSACRKSSVTNSYFTNIKKPTGTPFGPRFHSESTDNCEDISLINNVFYDMDGINFSPTRGRAIGNYFGHIRESALFMDAGNPGAPFDVLINSNIIDTTTAITGSANGIEGAGDNLIITNNSIKNCGGLAEGLMVSNSKNFVISNNKVSNCYHGICVRALSADSADGIITGNRVFNNTVYGVVAFAINPYAITSIIIVGNDLTDSGGTSVWGQVGDTGFGANCIRANNLGTTEESGIFRVGGLTVATKTPASAGASGIAGEICWDANYLYVCVATNSWKRIAIGAW